ncbi:hydrolase [Encephalitozoon cuniculi]|nr:hydrolase [Encephalitozoon cuniculi]
MDFFPPSMELGLAAMLSMYTILGVVILSLDFLFLLFTIQRSLYFFGKGMRRKPENIRVRLVSRGQSEVDLYLIDQMSSTDIIYLPGNFVVTREHIEFCKYLSKALRCNTVSMIYRGIAGNPHVPSERGIVEDVSTASEWLSRRSTRKVVVGFSIGAAVGIRLAGMCRVDALVLVNPFISLREVVSSIPLGRVLKHLVVDEWSNMNGVKDIDVPVYFVVSSDDEIVPESHADALIKRTRHPRKIVIRNADHNEPMRNFMVHVLPVVSEALVDGRQLDDKE